MARGGLLDMLSHPNADDDEQSDGAAPAPAPWRGSGPAPEPAGVAPQWNKLIPQILQAAQGAPFDPMSASTGGGPAPVAAKPKSPFDGSGLFSQYSQYAGAEEMSTNDYTQLPAPYNKPGYIMRNGHIMDTRNMNPMSYLQSLGFNFGSAMNGADGFRGNIAPSQQYPATLNWGKGGQMAFWPGDVTGWRLYTSQETD